MSDFNKSDVGFLQVGCRILAGRMAYFYKSDVGCRILTSRMSDGTYKLPYLLGIERQNKRKKFAIFNRKPRSHT